MPGTRSNKKGTPSKEIADFAQNKNVSKVGQLGEELAKYKNEETARVRQYEEKIVNYKNEETARARQYEEKEFTTEPHVQVGPSVQEVLLSLLQLPADQRRVLAAKLREVLQDTSINQGRKVTVLI